LRFLETNQSRLLIESARALVPTVLRGNAVFDAPRRRAVAKRGRTDLRLSVHDASAARIGRRRRASGTAFPRRAWERGSGGVAIIMCKKFALCVQFDTNRDLRDLVRDLGSDLRVFRTGDWILPRPERLARALQNTSDPASRKKPQPSREGAPGGLDRASGFPFPL
jgi:hypothetical protein